MALWTVRTLRKIRSWQKHEKYTSARAAERAPSSGTGSVLPRGVEHTPARGRAAGLSGERLPAKSSVSQRNSPQTLESVTCEGREPYPSGIAALDRVLGSGLVPGAAILLGGEPGIGKSTLLLQVAGSVSARGQKVLYASGEESLPQVRARAERLGLLNPRLMAMSTSSIEEVIAGMEEEKPALLILDSVQTMASLEAEGLPGNVSQVKAVATLLIEACRRLSVTGVIVGHVTKDGTLAGPRMLEHMVDTVVSLEGDRRQVFRLMRVFKNRFGPNEELLVFRMGRPWPRSCG